MDASKKQREPVAFKNLAELKRFIRPGVELKTVSHANHADMVGLTRVVTTVQTVGFYSKIKDQPEHPFSTCNHGKGFYTDFGKAGNYIFGKDEVGSSNLPSSSTETRCPARDSGFLLFFRRKIRLRKTHTETHTDKI